MDKHKPPTTFGIFKPVGHTVLAFASPDALQQAMQALGARGFAATSMVAYSAEEMRELVEDELGVAGPASSFGYEIELVRAHRGLAEQGCSFLVVHAPHAAQAERVADLLPTLQPLAAQHYGRFLIRDLTEHAPGQP